MTVMETLTLFLVVFAAMTFVVALTTLVIVLIKLIKSMKKK